MYKTVSFQMVGRTSILPKDGFFFVLQFGKVGPVALAFIMTYGTPILLLFRF